MFLWLISEMKLGIEFDASGWTDGLMVELTDYSVVLVRCCVVVLVVSVVTSNSNWEPTPLHSNPPPKKIATYILPAPRIDFSRSSQPLFLLLFLLLLLPPFGPSSPSGLK